MILHARERTSSVYGVPKGWQLFSVDQIKSTDQYACVAGPFGSSIASKFFVDDGVPVLRGSNLRDDLTRFVANNFVFISDDKAASFRAQQTKPGDLVFTCWGTIGQVGIVPEGLDYDRFVISNKQLKLRVDPQLAEPLFCFYYFASKQYVQYIRGRNIGGAVHGINLGILKSFPIALPSISDQRRIVTVLSAYDNLIANNERRIELLEQSARLLFKEWFVHLRYPGHQHVKIVDGVPEGWRRQQLGKVLTLHYGKALKEDKREPGDFGVYGSSGNVGKHNVKLVDGPGIVVGRKGNVGSVFWVDESFWPIDTVYYVEPENVSLFVLHLLQAQTFQNSDAAVPGLNRDYAYSTKILWPEKTLREEFEEFVSAMFAQRRTLLAAVSKLEAARDYLLPRLMDGRVSV